MGDDLVRVREGQSGFSLFEIASINSLVSSARPFSVTFWLSKTAAITT